MTKRALLLLLVAAAPVAGAEEVVIDFEKAEIGKPVAAWSDQGVVFNLSTPLAHSKAKGRVMFFPHIGTQHKGLLNAMALEQQVPVQATLPASASAVTVVFWGSTGCAALLEALNKEGQVIGQASLPAVPGRKAPADPVPFATLKVETPGIAAIRFSGPRSGEFLAADEIRIVYEDRLAARP